MKSLTIFFLLVFSLAMSAQATLDGWLNAQLTSVQWQKKYKGVLADFHPVTITLASDYTQIAGYLMHEGDNRKHRLSGEWSNTGKFQLQERDEHDRLTGYVNGTITDDQFLVDWISADQSRMFQIRAYPESLITIKRFKPVSEWIEIASAPPVSISVQKMDYGIVSGIASRDGQFVRFEGYCLDGSCSLWNTVIQNPSGAPVKVQMRQKDERTYRANLDGVEYAGTITETTPLVIRRFDNSMGFLDMVYPGFESPAFTSWLAGWVDPLWNDGVNYLQSINQPAQAGRLVHRSSGWIELYDHTPAFISGMITYINPGSIRRAPFILLKKEDILLSMPEWLNTPDDIKKASQQALLTVHAGEDDQGYNGWLHKSGYAYAFPTAKGVIAATDFNMIYGDDLQLLPMTLSREIVRRKYWKYFGW